MLEFFCGSLSVKSTQKSARQRTDLNNDQKFCCGKEHREGGVDNRGAINKRVDKRGATKKRGTRGVKKTRRQETRDKDKTTTDKRGRGEKENIEASRE